MENPAVPGSIPGPRDSFAHCPRCGASSAGNSHNRAFVCANCGFTLYFNIACAFGGLITDADGRLLLVRRAKEPSKGLLAFPGGFADPGEDAESGLRREVREEVGLSVEVTDYLCSHTNLYAYKEITYPVLDFFYLCRVVAPNDKPLTLQASEIAGSEWRDPSGIDPDEIAFASQQWALRCYREKIK
ncbi:MAG: NUDIX domain-containing protein [Cytophagales bacterium]|nr:NUDIX domain-containing protein [Armatimonadota bacterium]